MCCSFLKFERVVVYPEFLVCPESIRHKTTQFYSVVHRKIIGANIRAARHAKEWSQEKLAIRAKMNSAYLSELELGHENVSVDTLAKISKALRVPFSELVKGMD